MKRTLMAFFIFCSLSLQAAQVVVDYEKIAHRVTLQTGKELYEGFKLEPVGFGGGMMQKVQHMSLSLRVVEPITVEAARRLALSSLDLYLQNIRKTKELQEFLVEKPFPEKRVEIMFYVLNKDGTFKTTKSLANFYVDNSKIVYKNFNPDTKEFEKVLDETVSQARDIILQELKAKKK